MKIIIKNVGADAIVKEVEKLELEDMQKIVGGLIQPLCIEEGVMAWVNEEGKLKNLDFNIVLTDSKGTDILDVLVGNVFFTGDSEDGDVIGLTDEQIEKLLKALSTYGFLENSVTGEMKAVPVIQLE